MYSRDSKSRKSVIKMDPNCAICGAPAQAACDCEAKGLDVAIKQAEDHMMRSIYTEIRSWVRAHAQDYILEYFRLLTDRRKTAHSNHLDSITAHAWYHYNAPPHPQQIKDAQAQLKRGIDEDWQASVQRYPEVLEYFFGLVDLTLPADDDPSVVDPPLSAMSGHRKPSRPRGPGGGPGSHHEGPPAITAPPYLERGLERSHALSPRTPPPPPERRAPPRERRPNLRHSLPPHQTAPYQPHYTY